jgi:hypothetical protein
MFKKYFKSLLAIFSFCAIFGVVNFAVAATPDLGMQFGASIGLSSTDPRVIAARIIQIFLGFLGIIAVGLIIYAGFLWMTAAGNEDKIDQAKKTLVSAIIGLVIILSAFGIATFILTKILGAVGNGGNNNGGGSGGPAAGIGGAGIIGACSVESVYPTPNQKEVARNTSIIVTFKEDVDPSTICTTVTAGKCNGSFAKTSNIKIYKSKDDPTVGTNLVADAQVFNVDEKTFMFIPKTYLGSPSEYIWYTVNLSNNIVKPDGKSIFESCQGNYLRWQFEVSNKIDLIPPQILSGGVWPPPDNDRDTSNPSPAIQATGSITVNSVPKVYSPASVTSISSFVALDTAKAAVDPNYDQGGALVLTVFTKDGALGAELKKGSLLLGAPAIKDKTITFPGLVLTADNNINDGDQWTINVKAVVMPDTLTVGSMTYTFVAKDPNPNQIVPGKTAPTTAAIIKVSLATQADINAAVSGNKITITAVSAEKAGNNIPLNFTSPSNDGALTLSGSFLSGGDDSKAKILINGAADQPMNTAIQINFNEPIFPNNVVGDANDVKNVVRVINVDTGAILTGKFIISNQYKTLEFVSDNECGVNGCGEKIYCLPANSHLRVEIMAASLSAACTTGNDCLTKTPFTNCTGGFCNSPSDGNYPQGSVSAPDGVMDLSLNSLDGNRNKKAEGQASFYNENIPNASGDNFSWSFFISDVLDTTPPKINKTSPVKDATIGSTPDLEIDFDKIMMSGSLKTGTTVSNNGKTDVTHKNINVWNMASNPLGYWIASAPVRVDGSPVSTNAIVKHSDLSESMSYRTQVGSGVRDIYQNCFKVSSGPACVGANAVTDALPSCCNGKAVEALGTDGNCP